MQKKQIYIAIFILAFSLVFQISSPTLVLAKNKNFESKTKEVLIQIPGSDYFKLNKRLFEQLEVKPNNFKVEKNKKRYDFKSIENNFKSQIDYMIEKNNLTNIKYKKVSKENNEFVFFLLEIKEEDKEFYVLTTLVYNYRITNEIMFFNVKIEKSKKQQTKLDRYLKLLLNIEADYSLLPENFKEKIFENKQKNYNYYKKNRENIKIIVK